MAKKKLSSDQRKKVLKTLMSYISAYKASLAISIVSALLIVFFTLVFPMLTGNAVDYIIGRNYAAFKREVIVLLSVAILWALIAFIQNKANNRLTYSIVKDIRKDAFANLQRVKLSYQDGKLKGDIASRIITDSEQIADGLLMGFTQLLSGILTIFGTLGFLFYINWIVALVVVLVTPVSLFTASFIAGRTFNLFSKQNKARGEMTGYIDEMISSSNIVSAFGQEENVKKSFDTLNDKWAGFALFATFYSSLTNPVTRFVNSLVYAGVALSGGLSALMGRMTIGALSATLSYASQYTKPFNEISGVMTELQNALSSAERVFSLIEEKDIEVDRDGAISIDAPKGDIKAENLSFSYKKDVPLIENLNIDIKSGMKVAIVGPTGCGKTTLINLLMRFYDVDKGKITVDGRDVRDISFSSLRDAYGMVLQDTWIKTGTVRENIAYANPNASDEDIREAARLCHIDSLIDTLPHGYDEIISEDTDSISHGQKQLISIARVMLSDPHMLILDEATSSIDTRTEIQIQKAFNILMEGRTAFIVAHRLSTIRNADLILVMKDGNIIEQGSHEELISKKGFYYELYNSQFVKA
ncbi:MAG: ABC transporter ATP-binding protein [Spirochaetales bacterium]|nr:ABC transporter ATP-binding protein [Spirochaetales bacterium]